MRLAVEAGCVQDLLPAFPDLADRRPNERGSLELPGGQVAKHNLQAQRRVPLSHLLLPVQQLPEPNLLELLENPPEVISLPWRTVPSPRNPEYTLRNRLRVGVPRALRLGLHAPFDVHLVARSRLRHRTGFTPSSAETSSSAVTAASAFSGDKDTLPVERPTASSLEISMITSPWQRMERGQWQHKS